MFCCGLQNSISRSSARTLGRLVRDVLVASSVVAVPLGFEPARRDRPGDRLDGRPRPRAGEVGLPQLQQQGLAVGLGGRAELGLVFGQAALVGYCLDEALAGDSLGGQDGADPARRLR